MMHHFHTSTILILLSLWHCMGVHPCDKIYFRIYTPTGNLYLLWRTLFNIDSILFLFFFYWGLNSSHCGFLLYHLIKAFSPLCFSLFCRKGLLILHGLASDTNFLISISLVAGIIDMNHHSVLTCQYCLRINWCVSYHSKNKWKHGLLRL
jgi:hypothetical protein